MTEEQTQEESPVLLPDSLAILRKDLTLPGYTDKQLNRAAMFLCAPVISLGAALGIADESPIAIMSTANLAARTILADFINKGCINVSAIDRYMDAAAKLLEESIEDAKVQKVSPDGS